MKDKYLSAASYFSVLFMPLLLPIMLYVTSDAPLVKKHAKKAFLSQLIPMIFLLIGSLYMYRYFINFQQHIQSVNVPSFGGFQTSLLFSILYSVSFLIVLIWNIFQGIKVLR